VEGFLVNASILRQEAFFDFTKGENIKLWNTF